MVNKFSYQIDQEKIKDDFHKSDFNSPKLIAEMQELRKHDQGCSISLHPACFWDNVKHIGIGNFRWHWFKLYIEFYEDKTSWKEVDDELKPKPTRMLWDNTCEIDYYWNWDKSNKEIKNIDDMSEILHKIYTYLYKLQDQANMLDMNEVIVSHLSHWWDDNTQQLNQQYNIRIKSKDHTVDAINKLFTWDQ